MGHRARNQWATPEIDGTWLEGMYTGAALSLTLLTERVDVVLPYCLVCGLDNAPSLTAGPLNGSVNGAEVPPAMADKVRWELTPKGAVVSDFMLAVSSRRDRAAAANATAGGASAFRMRPLRFSPEQPLRPSLRGTAMLTGWAFVRGSSAVFDGAVFLHVRLQWRSLPPPSPLSCFLSPCLSPRSLALLSLSPPPPFDGKFLFISLLRTVPLRTELQ
jgi:hypothetical protein